VAITGKPKPIAPCASRPPAVWGAIEARIAPVLGAASGVVAMIGRG
jgi:hypothetical protein